jgi:hypothetical protein
MLDMVRLTQPWVLLYLVTSGTLLIHDSLFGPVEAHVPPLEENLALRREVLLLQDAVNGVIDWQHASGLSYPRSESE